MNANEMDAMNISEKAIAMKTINVGPRGMTPARVLGIACFRFLTGSAKRDFSLDLEDLEYPGFVPPGKAWLE